MGEGGVDSIHHVTALTNSCFMNITSPYIYLWALLNRPILVFYPDANLTKLLIYYDCIYIVIINTGLLK